MKMSRVQLINGSKTMDWKCLYLFACNLWFSQHEPTYGRKIVQEIINEIDNLYFVRQYQIDEILGEHYRRIILRKYRVIYKVLSENEIEILEIFDNRQSPGKTLKSFNE